MRQGGVTGRNTSEDGRTQERSSSNGETPSRFGSLSGRTPSRCGTREKIAGASGRTRPIPSRGHGTTATKSSSWRSGYEFAGTQPGTCSTAIRMEKQEMQHKELASQLSSRHAAELSALNEQLMEADNMRATYEKESALLKEKVEQSRQESAVENESKCEERTKTTENKRTTQQLLLEDTQRRILTQKRTDFIAMQKYFLSKQITIL